MRSLPGRSASATPGLPEPLVSARRVLLAFILGGLVLGLLPAPRARVMALYLPGLLLDYVLPGGVGLALYSPLAGLGIAVRGFLLLGVAAALPVAFVEAARLLAPRLGLRTAVLVGIVGFLLFTAGALLGLLVVAPTAIRLALAASRSMFGPGLDIFSGVLPLLDTVILLTVALGASMEAPLVAFILAAHGVVGPESLRGRGWRLLLFASMVLGMVVSPDPSGLGMLAAGSLIFTLTLVGIHLGARARRGRLE